MATPREKLDAAAAREAARALALEAAAEGWARHPGHVTREALQAAALAWTNAHHQTSRCRGKVKP